MSTKEKSEYKGNLDGFRGLDTSSPIGEGRTVALKNFKQLSDGSVEKRGGFKLLCTLDDKLRGEIAYVDGGEEVILAVAGGRLYRISVETGELSSEEHFSNSEEDACFFEFRGSLYLIESGNFYRYLGGTALTPVRAYAPLVSENQEMSPYYNRLSDPMNALTKRVRFKYTCDGFTIPVITTSITISSVDAIFIGDKLVDKSLYYLDKNGTQIHCDNLFAGAKGDPLTVYATALSGSDEKITGVSKASVFDSFENSRVFLYGGDDENRFLASSPVKDKAELARQGEIYNEEILPLYFPNGTEARFGGMEKISAMCRFYDRMLIFTKKRAFATEELSKKTDQGSIILETRSSTVGCSSDGAVRQIDGITPVSVSYGGIYKWELDKNLGEEIVVKRMSNEVSSLLTTAFFENARVCYNRIDDEMWFALYDTGEVLVYNATLKLWYTYTGIFAERFIETGFGVAFVNGSDVFVFDGGECDLTNDGVKHIEAYLESAIWCLSPQGAKKHVQGLYLTCELDGGSVTATLDDGIDTDSSTINGDGKVEFFDIRLRSPRTRQIKFKLSAGGLSKQRIYGVSLLTD